MKAASTRLGTRARKGAAPPAAATATTRDARTGAAGVVKVDASTGTHTPGARKAVQALPKVVVARVELDQKTGRIVAFSGSHVMAHDAVMKGVSGRALANLWESTKGALPADAVFKAIGVSARTAHRIKTDPDKPLDARATDGIYRLQSVRALAEEVLGSTEAANAWLTTEAMGLEYRRPIDLVSTSPGAEAVKTLLNRMKYGVYA